jgi:asparaginyl-tRNA synthetase
MFKAPVQVTTLTEASIAAAQSIDNKALVLYVSQDCQDCSWKKVAIVASMVGQSLKSIKLSDADFASLAPHARSLVLELKNGSRIIGPSAVARYIAGLREDIMMLGSTDFEEATVDQWVEFCWHELEVVCGACLLPARAGEPAFDKKQVAAMASKDAVAALGVMNSSLVSSTFLVGDQFTLADASALAAVSQLVTEIPELLQGTPMNKALPHVMRWFLTCAHHPSVSVVLGEEPVKKFNAISSTPPVQQLNVPSSGGGASSLSAASKPETGGKTSKAKPAAPAAGGKKIEYTNSVEGTPALELRFDRGRSRIVDVISGAVGVGSQVTVKGWTRTLRMANKNKLIFLVLNDGSCPMNLQCVIDKGIPGFSEAEPSKSGGTGASFSVSGEIVESGGGGQQVELRASSITLLGAVYGGEGDGLSVGGAKYPLSKKAHSFEHMRKMAHLRPRTAAYASTLRLRNAMAYATHTFFNERGFLYVHTPCITSADCEGAGEMFSVTTLLPEKKDKVPRLPNGDVDYSKDFFGAPAGLTVSGQLNVETHACALSDVYTFGPTFRAEDSHTSRHLAEFWMIEPELCFAGLKDDMDLAEDYLKFCVHYALTKCASDLEVLQQIEGWDKDLIPRLKNILEKPFARLTYTEAIKLLQEEVASKVVTFEENNIEWGMDLGSEHERYLAEKKFNGPIIVTNYPKGIKAFYMKLDDDGKTVQAMDILVPRIGEVIGGSVREDRYDVLLARAKDMGLEESDLDWYLDLRKYGSVPHAGFGLGFERLVMLVTGVENIRDVIPFPRYPDHCMF